MRAWVISPRPDRSTRGWRGNTATPPPARARPNNSSASRRRRPTRTSRPSSPNTAKASPARPDPRVNPKLESRIYPMDLIQPATPAAADRAVELVAKCRSENPRLDQYLVSTFPDFSRSVVRRVIDAGGVTVNGRPAKASYKVRHGDAI